MDAPVATAFAGLAAAVVVMTAVWGLSLRWRDASIIDVVWGLGFVALAWLYFACGDGSGPRRLLVPALVTLWGVRLSLHIWRRNRGRGEDPRYAAMRAKYGPRFAILSLPIVFWLQAGLLWAIALPLFQVQRVAAPLGWLDAVGLALFAVGFTFEAVGDHQLARFKADPAHRGKVCDRGLWRYTRHPNYFGDATLWWGLAAFALATPGSVWTLVSPALMTFLLLRVSGVTLLERGLRETKPGYADYVRRTSAFFPWPPQG